MSFGPPAWRAAKAQRCCMVNLQRVLMVCQAGPDLCRAQDVTRAQGIISDQVTRVMCPVHSA